MLPVLLWAVTITAGKHPAPWLLVLVAHPYHAAEINHPTSHPPCINRSAQEQGFLPRKQLYMHSTPWAHTGQHPEPSGSQSLSPSSQHCQQLGTGDCPAAGQEQTGREWGSDPLPSELSFQKGTTHLDQVLPCLGAIPVATPRVLLSQCRRVLGHYPHKMCKGTKWARTEAMASGHSWAAAAQVPWGQGDQPDG